MMTQLEKQRAFDYCTYMVASNYFNLNCISPIQEKKLFLCYQEGVKDGSGDKAAKGISNQMLEICEKAFERDVLGKLSESFRRAILNKKANICIVGSDEVPYSRFYIVLKKYVITVCGMYNGRRTELFTRVYRRPAKKA